MRPPRTWRSQGKKRRVSSMYKIIACDLDETLINAECRVSAENAEAIRRARQLGVKFVPATGRSFLGVEGVLSELGLCGAQDEYVISFNGGAITENKDHRLLHYDGLAFETASAIYRRGQRYDVCIHVYTTDNVFVYRCTEDEKRYITGRMPYTLTSESVLDFIKGQRIVKLLYVSTDQTYLRQIERDMQDLLRDVDVTYSSGRYLEFNNRGVNKGAGLLKIAELLQVPREQTIAIGDNFNDLPMLKTAGLGVCVQNAVDEIKSQCGYVTTATNNEHAVAEVIRKFIL